MSTDTPSDDGERPLELHSAPVRRPIRRARSCTRAAGSSERWNRRVEKLPAREGFIVRQRFGLGTEDSHTLEEISAHLGVSRERVRQLESRALAKLREVCSALGCRNTSTERWQPAVPADF